MEDSESVLLRSERSMEGEMKATLRRLLEDPACRRMLRCWFIADWPWIWATGVVGSRPSCHGNRSHFSQVQGCCDCLYVGCSYFDCFLFWGGRVGRGGLKVNNDMFTSHSANKIKVKGICIIWLPFLTLSCELYDIIVACYITRQTCKWKETVLLNVW